MSNDTKEILLTVLYLLVLVTGIISFIRGWIAASDAEYAKASYHAIGGFFSFWVVDSWTDKL